MSATKSLAHHGKRFIDIGANLTDQVFRGIYRGSTKHKDDFNSVLERAKGIGMEKIIVTCGNLEDSKTALDLVKEHDCLYSTVGCHPTYCNKFIDAENGATEYLSQLIQLACDNKDKVVSVGEFGLDYDRLHFCPKDVQLKYFEYQMELAESVKLPLFLHCRNAHDDFIDVLKKHRDCFSTGVVHSFDGTVAEAKSVLDLGLYIGINGCSLKTEENLNVAKTIPQDRLMIETDAPWCDIRSTHAGFKHVQSKFTSKKKEKWEAGCLVKGRNEPATIVQVLEVLAAIREESPEELAEACYQNTNRVFFSHL